MSNKPESASSEICRPDIANKIQTYRGVASGYSDGTVGGQTLDWHIDPPDAGSILEHNLVSNYSDRIKVQWNADINRNAKVCARENKSDKECLKCMDVIFSCPSGEIRVCSDPTLSDDQCPAFVCVPQITDVKILSDGKPLKEGEIFSNMPLAFEAVTKPSNIGYDSIVFNVYRKKTIVVAAASSEPGVEQTKTASSSTSSDDNAAAPAASGLVALASSFPDDEYEPNPAFFCSTIPGQKQCGTVVLNEGQYKVEAKFINHQSAPSHNKVFYVSYGTIQIDLRGAAIYIHSSDSSFTGYPIKNSHLSVEGIDVRVIVVAKEKSEKQYSAYTVGTIDVDDYSRWFAPGSEGSLAGDFSKVIKANSKTAPTLEQHLNDKKLKKDDLFYNLSEKRIKQWPDDWPEPQFFWEKMEHEASAPKTDSSRIYSYTITQNTPFSYWGGDDIKLTDFGVLRYRATVNITGSNKSVQTKDMEFALRLSVGSSEFGADPNNKEFLRWVSGFVNVPYEWGGHWYGGKDSSGKYVSARFECKDNKGNVMKDKDGNIVYCGKYEGYGTDCSGLVSAAAYLAGYSWATQKYGTSGLNGVSREIDKNDLQPGDILNKAGSHVVVVVKVTRENNTVSTFDIIHASGGGNKVLRQENISIDDDDYDNFKARRLCLNSSDCE